MLIPFQDPGPPNGRSVPKEGGAAPPAPAQLRPAPPRAAARPRSDAPSPPRGLAGPASRAGPRPHPGLGAARTAGRPRQPPDPGAPPAGVQRRGAGPQARPGAGAAAPPLAPPPRGPNTDCRRPRPGRAPGRLAGWGRRGPGLEALGANACKPLWLLGKRGALRGGPGPEVQLAPGAPRHPTDAQSPPGPASGGQRQRSPRPGPPPPGPRVRGARHARHTAPALRSVPPSRGAGAGGPKPSWP